MVCIVKGNHVWKLYIYIYMPSNCDSFLNHIHISILMFFVECHCLCSSHASFFWVISPLRPWGLVL